MFAFNRISQTVIFSLYLIIVLVNTVADPEGFGGYALIFGMLALVPIGLSQLFGSIIDYASQGAKSKLKWHLKYTIIVLSLFLVAGISQYLSFDALSVVLVAFAWGASLLLMFYYWYVIFVGYKRSGGDMPELLDETHSVEGLE